MKKYIKLLLWRLRLKKDGENIPATFFDPEDPDETWTHNTINIELGEHISSFDFVTVHGRAFHSTLYGKMDNDRLRKETTDMRKRIYKHYKLPWLK